MGSKLNALQLKTAYSLVIILSMLCLTGCGAQYGLDLGLSQKDSGGGVNALADGDPNPPDVNPDDPNPPDVDPDDPNPPDIGEICEHKVLVKVTDVFIRGENCRDEKVCSTDKEVDLCDLAKNFFGTLESTVKPSVRAMEMFTLIKLQLKSTGHRVMSKDGLQKICDLKVTAKSYSYPELNFEPKTPPMAYDVSKTVVFPFDEKVDVVNSGNGTCQLKMPVANSYTYKLEVK